MSHLSLKRNQVTSSPQNTPNRTEMGQDILPPSYNQQVLKCLARAPLIQAQSLVFSLVLCLSWWYTISCYTEMENKATCCPIWTVSKPVYWSFLFSHTMVLLAPQAKQETISHQWLPVGCWSAFTRFLSRYLYFETVGLQMIVWMGKAFDIFSQKPLRPRYYQNLAMEPQYTISGDKSVQDLVGGILLPHSNRQRVLFLYGNLSWIQ